MSAPANLLAEWARLLIESLWTSGVTDVVLSPGSRSTPFVLAVADLAARGRVRVYDVIDERSAAFFALGLARATGRPPLLVCTSGTAGAHYLPAVVEASQAYLPLLLLTADRPFELQDCAAPQTIDQTRLFGEHARAFIELGLPEENDGALVALRRRAAQAVHVAQFPTPGAVHLNARARKPLEPPPRDTESDAERDLRERVTALLAKPTRVFAPRSTPQPDGVEEIARALLRARRPLIVAGPAPITQSAARADVLALATLAGAPLLPEATSQLRFGSAERAVTPLLIDAFDTLLRAPRFRADAAPDLVVQLGAPPTSGLFDQYLAAHARDAERYVIAPHGWADPRSDAAGLLLADPAEAVSALITRLEALRAEDAGPKGEATRNDRARWAARWAAANETAWREIAALVESEPALSEAEAVRATVGSVPRGGLLALGNSLPIREVDTFCPASHATCEVLSQRGANGIDGLVSGAAGAAAAGRPVTLLLGDVSFQHDLGGLAVATAVRGPLVVVVLNNDGGRIFEQLPVARVGAVGDQLHHWTTPHGRTFAGAAALFGCRYALAPSRSELERALAEAASSTGCTVIEAKVPPDGATRMMRLLQARIDVALVREGLA